MTTERLTQGKASPSPLRVAVSAFATVIFILLVVGGAVLSLTPAGQGIGQFFNWLFAANTVQIWWYATRAAGIMAYLLLWFSTVLGLAVTSKYMDKMLDRMFTYDFHQFISLLSIGFLVIHVLVLLVDRYLPYTIAQILIPFISPYRPVWVGIGVITFYVTLLVTVTFYMRKQIGQKAFRVIHVFSLLAYVGGLVHGLYAGTDSALPTMQILYRLTGLVALFFTIYWLVLVIIRKIQRRSRPASLTGNTAQHSLPTH